MKISATVVYPVNVTVEVDDDTSTDTKWQTVVSAADKELTKDISPVIHSCSDESLIHKDSPEPESINSQSEMFDITLRSLRNTIKSFHPVIRYSNFLGGIRNKKGDLLVAKIEQINTALKNLMDEIVNAMSPKKR